MGRDWSSGWWRLLKSAYWGSYRFRARSSSDAGCISIVIVPGRRFMLAHRPFHKVFRPRAIQRYCLIRKRPDPQLLLADLPEARQSPGLDDQEEDDEAAEDHGLQVAHGVDGDIES